MKVNEAILTKRAVRQFSDKKLSKETIRRILNAGRRSQSSKNTQPWQFIAVEDPALLKKLAGLGTYAGHIEGAALAVGIVTPNPEQRWSILFDAGQAASYMQLAAWELEVGSCLATIYEPEAARELLGYPEDYYLHVAISFGYPADPSLITQPPAAGGRHSFDEIVHLDRWGSSLE
jgi:nitroreductase